MLSPSTARRRLGYTSCRSAIYLCVSRGRCESTRLATDSGSGFDSRRTTRSAAYGSRQHLASLLVLDDLALHPLQRVVDRLRVAAELLPHLLVGRSLEVHAERVGLELREAGAKREDQALKLLRRDHHDGRLLHGRSGQRVAERAVAVALLARRRVAERDVAVEGLVLEPRRRLDRGDDLPRDAELGERPERRLLVRAEVADRLVEADQSLLDQVLGVAAGEEVRARLEPHESRVAADQEVERRAVAVARLQDELQIL